MGAAVTSTPEQIEATKASLRKRVEQRKASMSPLAQEKHIQAIELRDVLAEVLGPLPTDHGDPGMPINPYSLHDDHELELCHGAWAEGFDVGKCWTLGHGSSGADRAERPECKACVEAQGLIDDLQERLEDFDS